MKTQHTPTPWKATQAGSGANWGIESGGRHIGVVIGIANPQQGKADAERIVACVNACEGINPEAVPEMLKELKHLATLLEPALNNGSKIPGLATINKLWLIIAKAEGRS